MEIAHNIIYKNATIWVKAALALIRDCPKKILARETNATELFYTFRKKTA